MEYPEIKYLGKEIKVQIDRPIGSKHPRYEHLYPINYGFIPGTRGGDGDEIDVYVLEEELPVEFIDGTIVALVHRKDDIENKLVLSPGNKDYSAKQIAGIIQFQEQFFDSEILTSKAFQHCLKNNLGLVSGKVELKKHDPNWKFVFALEAGMLRESLGDHINKIEHVGSTAINGIHAKPIIDIAVGVSDFSGIPNIVTIMERLGYTYRGENGIPMRHYFIKGEPRKFHLHLSLEASEIFQNNIIFRDTLNQSESLALAYQKLKLNLQQQYEFDRGKYTEAKNDFIQKVLLRPYSKL